MTAPAYRQTVSTLNDLVGEAHDRHEGVWGFKDPRTCLLWPIWQEVFGAHGIECRPVMAVRDARTVIASMMANYGLAQAEAEGIYVYRVFHSLQDVTEGWFFVQYRDWTRQPGEQLHSLATYCGIDDPSTDYERVVARTFRPGMDRHSIGSGLTVSGAVSEVDALLATFSGDSYEQNLIDEWCASIEKRMDGFRFVFTGIDRLRADPPSTGFRVLRKRISKRLRKLTT